MFSDRWLHVSGLRVTLRDRVRVAVRGIGGETWYMVHDPLTNEHARLRADAWHFLAQLKFHPSVGEAWRVAYASGEVGALTQPRVVQLISALYRRNLLTVSTNIDSARLVERGRLRRRKPVLQRMQTLLFLPVPLFDPDRALRRLAPVLRLIFGPIGLAVWLFVLSAACATLVERWGSVVDASSAMFAAPEPVMLFGAFILGKTLHEFGHAGICSRYGGRVHTLGVMLLVFAPLPYVDVSSAWAFRSRAARVAVGAGGMLVDVFVASLSTLIWAETPPGGLNDAAFSLMLTSATYAFVVNANPLMRFDGYYILADLLDVPNLAARASAAFAEVLRQHLLGQPASRDEDEVDSHHASLAAFGALALAYRVFAIGGIMLFLTDQYMGLGLLAAVTLGLGTAGPAIGRAARAWRARIARGQLIPGQARLKGLAVIALLFLLVSAPLPDWRTLPASIDAIDATQVSAGTAGRIQEIVAEPNSYHLAGDPLVRLEDPELHLERRTIELQLVRNAMMERRAISSGTADLEPIRERRRSLEQALAQTDTDLGALIVRAPRDGVWVAPAIRGRMFGWIERGTEVGTLVPDAGFRMIAVVPQAASASLARASDLTATLRCSGSAATALPVIDVRMVPLASSRLPNPALGAVSGGDIAVSGHDASGNMSAEPVFRLEGVLPRTEHGFLLHRRTCWARVALPPRSLSARWLEMSQQFLQRRYRL